ncbi:CBO0543 family protein [Halalkalibacter krulwichiae]|uniref:CBO0543 family protein n=1 Tax=Halalkalibacter krulwichiae TaxID=199441 RepID=UPI000A0610F1|nr:CBO0543 family protein [Halalkalibacter krulwichiae]
MNKTKVEKSALRVLLLFSIILLPFLLRRPPIKDWLLAFLLNAYSNVLIDKVIIHSGMLDYPIRVLPKKFNTNILFDHIIYPTFSVIVNQVTRYDKPLISALKIILMVLPINFIEFLAERKTDFIKWKKGWKWYHSFVSMCLKSMLNRYLVGVIRMIDRKKNSN